MRFWWVNHKQTFRQEVGGGYIWAPKTNRNGARNQTYDNLRLVAAGDVVFSYANQSIEHIGVAMSPAVSMDRPSEFGTAGESWDHDGWLVPVRWQAVPSPLSPKAFIDALRPHLPSRHSPISPETGKGQQNVYLAAISEGVARELFARIADNGSALLNEAAATASDEGSLEPFDEAIERSIRDDLTLDETTRNALIAARRGQGQFRRNVETIERVCRITGISDPRLLRASHIRPWRWCRSGSERLDGNNGLLLSPNADHLFDRGFITFEDDGYLVLSPLVDRNDIAKLGIAVSPPPNVGRFSPSQASHLRFHRENVFQQGK